MSDATNWVTVKVPERDHDTASDYKPDGVTWGDCLVTGAERLNDHRDSEPGPFDARAEISVFVPDDDLDAIREDIREAVDDAAGDGEIPVSLDAGERTKIAREVAEVLQG